MTGRLDLLQDIHLISPLLVKLPVGENVLTNQRGTIRLTSHIHLQNVYTNLISFGQLLTDHSLVGRFYRNAS